MRLINIILFVYFFLLNSSFSQITPEINWYHIYDGPGNGIDMVNDMKKDKLDQFYLAGRSAGSDGSQDLFINKYSFQMDTIINIRYSPVANTWDEASSIIIDSSLNIYVTGHSLSQTQSQMVLLKCNEDGNFIWGQFIQSAEGKKVILDSYNNPIVGGTIGLDVFLCKHSPLGDSLWYTTISDDTSEYELSDFIMDDDNNYYVSLMKYYYSGGCVAETYNLIIKIDSTGNILWSNSFPGSPG